MTPCRLCSAATVSRQQHCRRSVATPAQGHRAAGDTLSEQLAGLLPDQAVAGAEPQPQPAARRKRGRSKKQRNEKPEEEEDVEIFSIDGGWADNAFESPEELAALLSSSAGAGSLEGSLDCSLSGGGSFGAGASGRGELEAAWTAAEAAAEAEFDAEFDSSAEEDDGSEMSWTTANFVEFASAEVRAVPCFDSCCDCVHCRACPVGGVRSNPVGLAA